VSTGGGLLLFSGGLDSILAGRVVMAQGIRVVAVKFVSPFFNYAVLKEPENYQQSIKEKYDIDVLVEDISTAYMEILHHPAHGFGKNFNPCIDCKILMLKRAKEMMAELGCSFLITGEVLGQRPMSQRRDTLNVIERDSDSRSILLRPLSARLMRETTAESEGLIDRQRLLDFSGRGRSRQIALAHQFGITDFPSPAGGCILADPILSKRIERLFGGEFVIPAEKITIPDILFLLVGRQFLLPGGGWLILGRDEKENERLVRMAGREDVVLEMEERPGPTAVLRHGPDRNQDPQEQERDLSASAGLVVRYGKKVKSGPKGCRVEVTRGGTTQGLFADPLADEQFRDWMLFLKHS